jgi:hypothetical protein
MSHLADFVDNFTEALFYYGRDEEDEPEELDRHDLAEEAVIEIERDCRLFMAKNARLLEQAVEIYGIDQAAKDFYLTRCGHGCGYWDGDLPKDLGDQLTDASKEFGSITPYRGDDGKLYVCGG